MARKRTDKRRKPSVRRDRGEIVGVELVAFFRHRPENEYALVRGLIERALCFTDDPAARALYREHFGLKDTEPLPGVPLDSMIAGLCGTPVGRVEAASESGRLDWLSLRRWAGRGDRRRTSLEVYWSSHTRTRPELRLWFTLNDLPTASVYGVEAFITEFFDRVAEAGGCAYGRGEFRHASLRWWSNGGMGTHEPPVLMSEATRRLWWAMGDEAIDCVTGVHNVNYLSPVHLERLGGRDRLLREVEVRSKDIIDFWRPTWKEYPDGSLLLRTGRLALEPPAYLRITSDVAVQNEELAGWLLARFMAAGLVVGQAPGMLARLERAEQKARREWETQTAAAPRESEADAEAREKTLVEFMTRMWETPPTFIAGVAHPLGVRTRAGLSRARGGHGQQRTGFRIARSAKAGPTTIWARITRHGEPRPPFAIGGPTAKTALCVFDPSRHGFDGECGHGPEASKRTLDSYHCSRCGHDKFEVVFLFEYGEPEELEEPEIKKRPQDFFSWFTVRTRCAGCGKKAEIGNVECA